MLAKELRLERRAPQTLVAMTLFSATTYVSSTSRSTATRVDGQLAAGVLWVTMLLAALLGIGRLFVSDRDEGGLEGFLLAPVDRTRAAVRQGRGAAGCSCSRCRLVAVPLFALLLLGPTPSAGTWLRLLLVVVLADAGIAVVGTLVAAIAVQTRARDLITSILALPLLVPVMIGASRAHRAAAPGGRCRAPRQGDGWRSLRCTVSSSHCWPTRSSTSSSRTDRHT